MRPLQFHWRQRVVFYFGFDAYLNLDRQFFLGFGRRPPKQARCAGTYAFSILASWNWRPFPKEPGRELLRHRWPRCFNLEVNHRHVIGMA